MTFTELEKEMEMRSCISKGIYDRMHELRYHIEMELKHLGEYLKMENIPKASASWLILYAAENDDSRTYVRRKQLPGTCFFDGIVRP